jgi:hypothetical protein
VTRKRDVFVRFRAPLANANNTPRIARVDLKTFETVEIIELPNNKSFFSIYY